MLSQKHVDAREASSDTFCILPELENLELIRVAFTLHELPGVHRYPLEGGGEETEVSNTVTMHVQLSLDTKFSAASDPANSSTIRSAVKSFTG